MLRSALTGGGGGGGGSGGSGSGSGATSGPDFATMPHCPIVYGSMAFWLGKRTTGSDREHSHRWTIYLRGAKGFDVATCIKSVTFTLHHSFAQPNREITQPPFEVTETGWGEFEIAIHILFHDPSQPPVSVVHLLKLHPSPHTQASQHKPVVSETYDEIVFIDPTPTMTRLLALPKDLAALARSRALEAAGESEAAAAVAAPVPPGLVEGLEMGSSSAADDPMLGGASALTPAPSPSPAVPHFYSAFDEEPDLRAIAAGRAFVQREIEMLTERLRRANGEKVHLQESIAALGEDSPAVIA